VFSIPLPFAREAGDYRRACREGDVATRTETATQEPATRTESFALLALAIVLFGTAWPAMKIGLAGATPIWFAAARAILGAAASFLLLPLFGHLRLPTRQDLPIILSIGVFQMTGFFALANLALRYLPAGRSAVLAYTTALWLVPLAVIFGEAVPPRRWLGVATGLLGIVVLANPLVLDWHDSGVVTGHLLLLLASLCWALVIFHSRRHVWRLTPLQILPWQMLLASVLLVILAALFEPDGRIGTEPSVLLALLYLGIPCGPLASWAATSVARALPTLVSSLGFLGVPALGLVISTLWMGEAVTPALLGGTALIGAGLVLVMTARQQ
jgi:drug/metabolite transporter (DMT)-like permease